MNFAKLGAHMPAAGGAFKAVERGAAIGCEAIQIFTSPPQQRNVKPVTEDMVENFVAAKKKYGINHFVSHDSYLINLCATDAEIEAKSIEGLKAEINRCHQLGVPFVVSHMGSHLGQGPEIGLKRVAENAIKVLAQTPDDVMLLMETTAGQGSALNAKIDEIKWLIEAINQPTRLGVCLDTAHLFVAGYDMRTAETYEATMTEIVSKLGRESIKVIHCNDSKKEFGSRVDRHEHIGQGFIGLEAFKHLVNDPRWTESLIILETPDAEASHKMNLDTLKSLRKPSL